MRILFNFLLIYQEFQKSDRVLGVWFTCGSTKSLSPAHIVFQLSPGETPKLRTGDNIQEFLGMFYPKNIVFRVKMKVTAHRKMF